MESLWPQHNISHSWRCGRWLIEVCTCMRSVLIPVSMSVATFKIPSSPRKPPWAVFFSKRGKYENQSTVFILNQLAKPLLRDAKNSRCSGQDSMPRTKNPLKGPVFHRRYFSNNKIISQTCLLTGRKNGRLIVFQYFQPTFKVGGMIFYHRIHKANMTNHESRAKLSSGGLAGL